MIVSRLIRGWKHGSSQDGEATLATSPYQVDPAFPELPKGMKRAAVSRVATQSDGDVLVFHRGRQPILVFSPDGKYLRSFGEGLFDSTHGLRRDSAGDIWTTDDRNHTVVKLSVDGDVLLALGERNVKGDSNRLFDRPTDVAFGANGDIFVADGYGNSRVAKLDRDGNFLLAWGKKGSGVGEFNLPHAIALDSEGLVYVGDRENDRIQVFDPNGRFIRQFGGFAPFGLHIAPDDRLFVADGRANKVMVMTQEGKVLHEWGKRGAKPGHFNMPHGITVAADGAVYVSEILGKRVQKFVPRQLAA